MRLVNLEVVDQLDLRVLRGKMDSLDLRVIKVVCFSYLLSMPLLYTEALFGKKTKKFCSLSIEMLFITSKLITLNRDSNTTTVNGFLCQAILEEMDHQVQLETVVQRGLLAHRDQQDHRVNAENLECVVNRAHKEIQVQTVALVQLVLLEETESQEILDQLVPKAHRVLMVTRGLLDQQGQEDQMV